MALDTWGKIVLREPRLLNLERWTYRQRFSWIIYEQMKRRLQWLVGWNVRDPDLSTNDVWDLCLQYLLNILETKSALANTSMPVVDLKFLEVRSGQLWL
jgi:hypothetical protein